MSDAEMVDEVLRAALGDLAGESDGSPAPESEAAPQEAAAPPADASSATPEPQADAQPPDAQAAPESQARTGEQAPAPPPEPATPSTINWDAPENPYVADATAARQMRQYMQQLEAIQREQALQQQIAEITDGDPERANALNQVLAQMRGPQQQAQSDAERNAKLATVMHIAMKAHLPEEQLTQVLDEVNRAMAVQGGPQDAERDIVGRLTERKQFRSQLSAQEAKIAELQKQLAAVGATQQRLESGADRVDGGSSSGAPSGTYYEQAAQAETFDDFWKALPFNQ